LFLILFHSDICVDFLGTHMISLVLFFRKPGVTIFADVELLWSVADDIPFGSAGSLIGNGVN
jgi:hypothetical protein